MALKSKKDKYADVPPILRNYLNFLTIIKGKSENTVREYYYDLRMFLRYVQCIVNDLSLNEISNVKLDDFDEPDLYGRELGYVLSKEHWGKGLMPEAVKAVIDYCFSILRYDFLLCAHFSRNDQSRRVIEKSGFAYVKDIFHETRFGSIEPTKLYVLYNPALER